MKERILHILTAPRAEGTPRLVLDCLAVTGYAQGVLCLAAAPAELEGDLRAASSWMCVTDVVAPGGRKYLEIPRAVATACTEFNPTVIIGWPTWTAGLIALGARRVGRARLVQHCGNPAGQEWGARFTSDLRFLPFFAAGGRFACCSDYVRDSFRRRTPFFKSRFQTVYNCIRAAGIAERAVGARKSRPSSDGRNIVMVATMEDHKDHVTLLRAMAILAPKRMGLRLRLAGDGRLRPQLERLANDLGLAAHVDFLGSRRDVPELLGSSDLFVFSTTPQEGLGIVLIEAMAAGVPILASDVPACRELLAGGRYGALVDPARPDLLAAAIEQRLGSDGETAGGRSSLAATCVHAASFSPERMLRSYLELSRTDAGR